MVARKHFLLSNRALQDTIKSSVEILRNQPDHTVDRTARSYRSNSKIGITITFILDGYLPSRTFLPREPDFLNLSRLSFKYVLVLSGTFWSNWTRLVIFVSRLVVSLVKSYGLSKKLFNRKFYLTTWSGLRVVELVPVLDRNET